MWKGKVACVLAVIALCGAMTAGAADYTILEKAEKVETTVYGAPQSGSLNTRIDALDRTLNGQELLTGSIQNQTDALYTDVYGNSGSDLSLLAAVNMMQWQYSGKITDAPLLDRVAALEEGINGKAATGSLIGRVRSLRTAMLGNTAFTSQDVVIPAGTIVTMKNLDPLDSETLQKGDIVRFSVAEVVMVGNVIAIPRGMEADGTATTVRKAGRFGRDGKIEITYSTVRAADGTPVPLTVGEKTKEQYKRTAGAVGASAAGAIILGPVGLVGGLFVKGNDVNIPAGTTMYAEVKMATEVIGFIEKQQPVSTMASANMAASGVAVPASEQVVAAATTTATVTPDTGDGGNVTIPEQDKTEHVTPVSLDTTGVPAHDDVQATVTITPANNN